MTCEDLVPGCFGSGTTLFADRAFDRDSALKYLTCCHKAHLSWKEVETQIRTYLARKGILPELVEQQVQRARDLMQAWLE